MAWKRKIIRKSSWLVQLLPWWEHGSPAPHFPANAHIWGYLGVLPRWLSLVRMHGWRKKGGAEGETLTQGERDRDKDRQTDRQTTDREGILV